ncbi:META domain-containing protein [Streptomyces sp. NEAU-W12]|uniref:META domain-containing protein n=1 Tax=Streptomyces sp. NEAU-W12 TaxID=2994668 RepID=UPI00224AA901|nr:META domain-containing protein [Streptomyces sp. NEAU-W12]MCX2922067.1 META domain-containing protein [Streptomyces sp. NEAU-W12]
MYRQKQQQRMPLAVAAAVLVPFAAACGNEQAGAGSGSAGAEKPVTGIRWTVDSVTVDGTTHRATSDAYMTLSEGGKAEGHYGCNGFRADAALDGDRVRFAAVETTVKACDEPLMDFEHLLGKTLTDGALRTEPGNDRLTLTSEGGDTVRLSRGGGNTPLYGTEWRITSPDAAGRAHLTFDEEKGTVSGSLGCNRANADATVRDGHITLGTPATTRMVCEDSLMEAEKRLLRLFDTTLSYRVDHRNMTLTSENGTTVEAFATG